MEHGRETEETVREIAAQLGVADFVYVTLKQTAKGNAQREASGDGLLIVGDRGAVLQVKSRAPAKRPSDTPDKAGRWADKHAKKALSQGRGTRRGLARLASDGTPLQLLPVRALDLHDDTREKYRLTLDANPNVWPVIVILDHDGAAGFDLGFEEDAVWMTLQDWEALHQRLRSTSAILDYVRRVLSDGAHVHLGHEAARYRALHDADLQFVRDSGSTTTVPATPDPDHFDILGANIYRDIIDKVWPDDGRIPWTSADEYRSIVEFLDRVPPPIQGIVGRWLLGKRSDLAAGHHRSSGLVVVNDGDRLVYTCRRRDTIEKDEHWAAEVASLASLRHVEALQTGAPPDSTTLAVGALVEPPPAIGVAYVFTMLQGQQHSDLLAPHEQRVLQWEYGKFNHQRGTTTPLVVNRKDPCPCGSGKKFKRCCGS